MRVASPESGSESDIETRSPYRRTQRLSLRLGGPARRTPRARNNRRPRVRSYDRGERRSIRRIPISRPTEPHYTSAARTSEAETCIGRASVKARSRAAAAAAARPRSIEVHRRGDLSLWHARTLTSPSLLFSLSILSPSHLIPLSLSFSLRPSSRILVYLERALSVAPVSISPAARCLVARVTRQLA